jgi:16S rRNA (guanine1516-N2)-methyltransferase
MSAWTPRRRQLLQLRTGKNVQTGDVNLGLWVTTAYDTTAQLIREAKEAARTLGANWVPRNRHSLKKLMETLPAAQLLVATANGFYLYFDPAEKPVRFHPSTAFLRIERLTRGGYDPLVEATAVQPGDSVLDGTAGLASDAIVLAHAVGENGSVIALESEKALCYVVRDGLKRYQSESAAVNEAMRRVKLKCADHRSYLHTLPSRSFDIVYFDPMFRRPITDSASMEPLRGVANPEPLSTETIEQAVRVARKRVVVKEHADGKELRRLDFDDIRPNKDGTIAYGVMKV